MVVYSCPDEALLCYCKITDTIIKVSCVEKYWILIAGYSGLPAIVSRRSPARDLNQVNCDWGDQPTNTKKRPRLWPKPRIESIRKVDQDIYKEGVCDDMTWYEVTLIQIVKMIFYGVIVMLMQKLVIRIMILMNWWTIDNGDRVMMMMMMIEWYWWWW